MSLPIVQRMKAFLRAFSTDIPDMPPCWFMRQAGRYLPEYRALREKSGGFLQMCYTPELATEITLQPIRRFNMDAAIIFSDILVIPHGLGLNLEFIAGTGPQLEVIANQTQCDALDIDKMTAFLKPVYQALTQTREALPQETTLIGFAGAPWTLLCYMLDGNGKEQFINARSAIYQKPDLVEGIINILTDAIAVHLINQIEAGAEAVQLFDSWAAHVPTTHRDTLIYQPTKRIVERVRAAHPDVPILCFPRGVGAVDYQAFASIVKPDGLSVDYCTDITALRDVIDPSITLQGNLDPLQLIHDSEGMVAQVKSLKQAMQGRRFVMNLGHGVLPSTPVEHMAQLVEAIRS